MTQQHAQKRSTFVQLSNLDATLLHKENFLHLAALVVDDAFGWDHPFSQHKRHALYSVGRQVLELRHLQALLRCFL